MEVPDSKQASNRYKSLFTRNEPDIRSGHFAWLCMTEFMNEQHDAQIYNISIPDTITYSAHH
jgi:hypothetical protein